YRHAAKLDSTISMAADPYQRLLHGCADFRYCPGAATRAPAVLAVADDDPGTQPHRFATTRCTVAGGSGTGRVAAVVWHWPRPVPTDSDAGFRHFRSVRRDADGSRLRVAQRS